MTKRSVYLETSVIGYATSRPSRDLVVAARQQITREWFAGGGEAYELFVSQLVIREASSGDEDAAAERLGLVEGIALLAITDAAGELAAGLVDEGGVPAHAGEDALHIAVAAVHGVDFLLTWNCGISPTPRCAITSNGCAGKRATSRRSSVRPRS